MARAPTSKAEERDGLFGARLRRARESAHLTQEELASRAGLTPNAVGALERGEHRHPYPATVRALSAALDLPDEERTALAGSVPVRGRSATEQGAWVSALPAPLSRLIGRESEVAAVGDLVRRDGVRLATLTGPGGVGKTRLALEIAADLANDFTDGAAFVSLAAVRHPDAVADAIAQSLGVRNSGGRSPNHGMEDALRARHQLLVLDNFEHLLASAPLVTDLLGKCHRLVVLATSRAALRINGEHEIPVLPLALPDPAREPRVGEIAKSAAIQLFVERARAVDPGFMLSADNAAAVAAVCHHLDGLPLAIELAAARSRLFSPAVLLPRLARRLPLLTGGRRDAPDRHRTMRDAIAWSYDTLGVADQALFRRLAVFAGGFSFEAATFVAGGGEQDALDGVGALLENSLLRRMDRARDAPRYAMLETVREYAGEQLTASGDAAAARNQHAAWCLDLVERAAPYWFTSAQTAWGEDLDADHDNLRAALAWAAEGGGTPIGLRLAGRLWPFWFVRGHQEEGRVWLERALTWGGGVPSIERVRVLTGASCLARGLGTDTRATAWGEEARAVAEAIGAGEGIDAAHVLIGLTLDAAVADDFEKVASLSFQALTILRKLRDIEPSAAPVEGSILSILAEAALEQGDDARATSLAEAALAHQRRFGFTWAAADALYLLALIAEREGRTAVAALRCQESLELAREHQDPQQVPLAFDLIARLARASGHVAAGARLVGAADKLYARLGLPLEARRTSDTVAIRECLGETEYAAAVASGHALTTEHAIAEALALATDIAASVAISPG